MRPSFALALLLALTALIACVTSGHRPPPPPLENTQWRLAELGERYDIAGDTLTLIGRGGPLARLVSAVRR